MWEDSEKNWKLQDLRILLAAICGLIFVICFSLYRFPIKAVLYPMALCGLVCIGFLIFDYLNIQEKIPEIGTDAVRWENEYRTFAGSRKIRWRGIQLYLAWLKKFLKNLINRVTILALSEETGEGTQKFPNLFFLFSGEMCFLLNRINKNN